MGVRNPEFDIGDENADQGAQLQELDSSFLAQNRPCRQVFPQQEPDARITYVQHLYQRVWTLLEEYMQNNLILRDRMQEVAGEIALLTATNKCFSEHLHH